MYSDWLFLRKYLIYEKSSGWFFYFLICVDCVCICIPFFFKDKIIAKAKEEISKQINAKVDFKSIDLSLLKKH
jgi:hypothetical protein